MPGPDARSPGVVTTIAARCRRCYNCVRSCPAKAIRVHGGQAEVMTERCIGCGNCIRVCAQEAKQVESAVGVVEELLAGGGPVVALLAPSYPAAFDHLSAGQVVEACRKLGFTRVLNVGFGAEQVAAQYGRLLRHPPATPLITTPCPALVSYVQKFMPDLVPNLAPVVSPMIALGRAVKGRLVPGAHVVFIGPCVAKKAEIREVPVTGAVDAVLTFQELQQLLVRREIDAAALPAGDCDDPQPCYGALFPVSGGLLKAAAIRSDLMDDSILVVEGPDRCITALQEVRAGAFPARFLDALLCEGCIAGPAFGGTASVLARKSQVTAHVRQLQRSERHLPRALRAVADTDLARTFEDQGMVLSQPTEIEIRDILARTNKLTPDQELNCGACGYPTCRDKAIAVYQGSAEPEMCLPFLVDQLEVNLERLSRSKEEIERAREIASRAQELASMGKLASDIAHEISTPLGSILVYGQLLMDQMPTDDPRREDLTGIIAEALHCREVLTGLQGFSRQREPQLQETTVGCIVDLALAELQQRLALTQATLEVSLAEDLPGIVADPQLLSQVLVHLGTNALDAMGDHGALRIEGTTSADGASVELRVLDQGPGIDPAILPQIFQPFTTTKTERPGAGLGLAAAHGIVQAHSGEIVLASEPGKGTTVTVKLPVSTPSKAAVETAKVMVVDDDPDFLEQHRFLLEATGFQVTCAERSDEALEIAGKEIPDAFVLDLMMERSDSGARLARALRRDPRFRTAPIVMLTSVVRDIGFDYYRNPDEVLDWMRADAWFDKPVDVAGLVRKLRELLAARRPEGPAA